MSDRVRTTTPSEAEAELLARAAVYRLLALTLADPVDTPVATEDDFGVAAAAADLLQNTELQAAIEEMKGLRLQTADERRAAYTSLFGLVVSPEAPPFEVEYEEKVDLFYRTQRTADIAGFYRAFKLDLARRERPDHIAVEAEFLWYLLERIVAARMHRHGPDREELLASTFCTFFADHFGGWAESFSERMRTLAEARRLPFFEAAADVLKQFVVGERERLDLPETQLRTPQAVAPPPEKDSDGCPAPQPTLRS